MNTKYKPYKKALPSPDAHTKTSLSSILGNQSYLSITSAPIQLKRWSIDELEAILRAELTNLEQKLDDPYSKSRYDQLEDAFTYLDVEPERVMHLLHINGTVIDASSPQHDLTFSKSRGQYLSPAILRANMGGKNLIIGGEAHHIIPSCIAEQYKFSQDLMNQAWNGIILPGCSHGTLGIINPMTNGTFALPYHRPPSGAYDHASYNKYMATKIDAIGGITATNDDLYKLAERIRYSIIDMRSGHLDMFG